MRQKEVLIIGVLAFVFPSAQLLAKPLFDLAGTYPVGSYPSSIFVADLDGDGDPDLAVTNEYSNSVSILKNNGDGTFNSSVDYGTGNQPRSIFAADFDGDGDQDLAVANSNEYLDSTISILKNNGDGTFDAKVDYNLGTAPSSVFASDLDKDGDLDLVVTITSWDGSGGLSVLKNSGDGTFPTRSNYSTGVFQSSAFVSDLDRDADNDVIVLSQAVEQNAALLNFPDYATVWLNNGSGTFLFKDFYDLGYGPFSVFASDLDEDGDQDLAIRDFYGISIFKNKGDGTFVADTVKYERGFGVFASDLDGDGDPDLATCGFNVLLNNGDGTFVSVIDSLAFGGSPFPSDLDGDGDKDLVVLINDSVKVLKNLTNVSTRKGDLDRDANLTASDVVLMLNCAFLGEGSNCSLASADVNCDGILSAADVVTELNAVFLNKPFFFPCI